jgi:flagella basal body P-ring formation protein FlgA
VQLRRSTALVLVGILTLVAGALTADIRADEIDTRWQPPETIAEAARSAAAATGAGEVAAVAIDPRLKLSRCASPLDAKIERPITRGAGTVTESCSEPAPWRLFVPERVTNDVSVLVLARIVQPGYLLRD